MNYGQQHQIHFNSEHFSELTNKEATIGTGKLQGMRVSDSGPWGCHGCDFRNAEGRGRFCTMCGIPRLLNNSRMMKNISTQRSHHVGDGPSGKGLTAQTCSKSSQDAFAQMDKSFSVLGLLENECDDTGTALTDSVDRQSEESNALNKRDFQMSFANWSMSDQEAWTCSACTFVNANPLHLQCEVCGQNRPTKSNRGAGMKAHHPEDLQASYSTGQSHFLLKQQEEMEQIDEHDLVLARLREFKEYEEEMHKELVGEAAS